MTDSQILALELGSKGYTCAQIVMIGTLRLIGEENPILVKALSALSQGIANTGNICGALAGGACVLSMYTAKGEDSEQAKKEEAMLLEELTSWFVEEFQHFNCDELLGVANCVPTEGNPCPERKMGNEKCGVIVAKVWDKCLSLLTEYNIDPYEIPQSN